MCNNYPELEKDGTSLFTRPSRDLPPAELVELVPLRLAVADHDDLVLAGHLEQGSGSPSSTS